LCLDIVNDYFIKKKWVYNNYELLFTFIENKIEPELDPSNIDWLTEKVFSFWNYRKGNDKDNFRKTIQLPNIETSPEKIKHLLSRYENTKNKLSKNPIAKLNNGHNMWIMKPADKSKGVGIEVKHSLNSILSTITKIDNTQERAEWYIIQKYIEQPLL